MARLRLQKRTLILALGGALLIGIVTTLTLVFWPHQVVPSKIKKVQTSTLYVPSSEIVTVRSNTFKYDSNEKLTTYKINYSAINLTISEQPSPDIFADIPDAYQKVINGLNNYATFDSTNGTVYLTRPPNQGNKQVGVMNAKGTLMFVTADKNLTNDQWRQLFNTLNIVK